MPTSYPIYKDSVRNWFLQNVPLDTTILDIGAGCGTYSDLLRGYGYKMDAVEIWEPYINQYGLKNKYGWVYEENVLKMPLDVLGAYDFYILGDVLEGAQLPVLTIRIDEPEVSAKGIFPEMR